MIALYTFLLLTVGAVKVLAAWRAGRFERRYARAALAAEKLLRAPEPKAGNGNRAADAAAAAKRQYQLGMLVQRRDALEARHAFWQALADRLGGWVAAVRTWRGRKLPYTAGVLDVWMLLVLLDYLGAGDYLNARQVVREVTQWLQNGL
jgi:hypothetical protein